MPTLPSSEETANTLKKLLKEPYDIYDFKNLTNAGERQDAARLDELRRTFMNLISNNVLILGKENEKKDTDKWNTWLCRQHAKFIRQLCDRIRLGKKYALRTYFGVLASSPYEIQCDSTYYKQTPKTIREYLMRQMVSALCDRRKRSTKGEVVKDEQKGTSTKQSSSTMMNLTRKKSRLMIDDQLLNLLEVEFIRPFRDVQYHMLLAIKDIANGVSKMGNEEKEAKDSVLSVISDNIGQLLMYINIAKSQDELDNGGFLIKLPEKKIENNKAEKIINDDSDDEGSVGKNWDSADSDSDSETDISGDEGQSKRKKRKRNVNASRVVDTGKRSKKKYKRDEQGRNVLREQRPFFQRFSRHRGMLSEAWIATLYLPFMSQLGHKRALQFIPKNIIPIMHNPLRLADYFTERYNMGGLTSLLSLNGLFILMTKHGLEYPKFYSSLYALVHPKVFYSKHRTRFFQLLNICLVSSQMLPAYVVAAFCKRLCRCALSAPPSGALFVLALVSNLLRKHEECSCLIHREGNVVDTKSEKEKLLVDVYDANTNDPTKCRVLESSLWELGALEKHFLPAISALARVCGREDENAPLHDLDDFLLHTYKSLFDQENASSNIKKRSNKKVPLTFNEPKSLFVSNDIFLGNEDEGGILTIPDIDE